MYKVSLKICHSREGVNPEATDLSAVYKCWINAFAGMT